MNQRITNLIFHRDNEFVFHIDGSRHATKEDAYAHGQQIVSNLDRIAGRPASDRELRMGFTPVENRDIRQKVNDGAVHIRPTENEPSNPFRKLQAMQASGEYVRPGGHKFEETEEQRTERLAQVWDADQANKKAEAERLADPARQKAVAHAIQERQKLIYTPGFTTSELVEAEQRIELSKNGSLDDYAKADREWREAKAGKLREAESLVDAQIAQLRASKEQLSNAAFIPVEPPGQAADSGPSVRLNLRTGEYTTR